MVLHKFLHIYILQCVMEMDSINSECMMIWFALLSQQIYISLSEVELDFRVGRDGGEMKTETEYQTQFDTVRWGILVENSVLSFPVIFLYLYLSVIRLFHTPPPPLLLSCFPFTMMT